MSSDGTFATVVATSMLLFLGALVAFYGYRLFWIILPIWGFFFGLAIEQRRACKRSSATGSCRPG